MFKQRGQGDARGAATSGTTRRNALAAVTGALIAGGPGTGRAQPGSDWPTQPVRYINIFPPGGATDTLSRLWCAKMGEIAGQPFVVENRSGSGGNVGADAIAKSKPDGYTIGLALQLHFDWVGAFTVGDGECAGERSIVRGHAGAVGIIAAGGESTDAAGLWSAACRAVGWVVPRRFAWS